MLTSLGFGKFLIEELPHQGKAARGLIASAFIGVQRASVMAGALVVDTALFVLGCGDDRHGYR